MTECLGSMQLMLTPVRHHCQLNYPGDSARLITVSAHILVSLDGTVCGNTEHRGSPHTWRHESRAELHLGCSHFLGCLSTGWPCRCGRNGCRGCLLFRHRTSWSACHSLCRSVAASRAEGFGRHLPRLPWLSNLEGCAATTGA